MKLGLVSCTSKKKNHKCRAEEMYLASPLFRRAWNYARKNYDINIILSAKYGLLLPDDEISPYNLALKNMRKEDRKRWAENVFKQMKNRLKLRDIKEAYFHTGKEYREFLIPKLEKIGIKCFVPLKGLPIGKQLRWYAEWMNSKNF